MQDGGRQSESVPMQCGIRSISLWTGSKWDDSADCLNWECRLSELRVQTVWTESADCLSWECRLSELRVWCSDHCSVSLLISHIYPSQSSVIPNLKSSDLFVHNLLWHCLPILIWLGFSICIPNIVCCQWVWARFHKLFYIIVDVCIWCTFVLLLNLVWWLHLYIYIFYYTNIFLNKTHCRTITNMLGQIY